MQPAVFGLLEEFGASQPSPARPERLHGQRAGHPGSEGEQKREAERTKVGHGGMEWWGPRGPMQRHVASIGVSESRLENGFGKSPTAIPGVL